MADTGDNGTEIQAHAETWHDFASLMKWATIAVGLIAALVVFLIAS
jgi:hypothetical protein